jgi:GNAT superfamily N-acetyltransferase
MKIIPLSTLWGERVGVRGVLYFHGRKPNIVIARREAPWQSHGYPARFMNAEHPILCQDRSGRPFEVRACSIHDFACLMTMYEVFLPRPASQGLPPPEPETCRRWVTSLLEIAVNILAWQDNKVIGHAALIMDPGGQSGEFVIFVHQDYRNLFVGTELTRLTLQKAKELGCKTVWLTVSVTNFIAIRLYLRVGFTYCDMDDCERTMRINV